MLLKRSIESPIISISFSATRMIATDPSGPLWEHPLDFRMEQSVGRDEAFELDRGLIEANRAAVEFGDASARLDYERNPRGDVPFAFGSKCKGGVGTTSGNQRKLIS